MFSFLPGISLFPCPTVSNMGFPQEKCTVVPMEVTEEYELPDDFAIHILSAVVFKKEIVETHNVTTTIKKAI